MHGTNKWEHCTIHLVSGKVIKSVLKYCGQMGTKNWHYYLDQTGRYFHIRAENIEYVEVVQDTVDKT